METEAYIKWKRLFDDTISISYSMERQELKNTSMLLTALKTELKHVGEALDLEFLYLRQQLKHKDYMKTTLEKNTLQNSKRAQKAVKVTLPKTNLQTENVQLDKPDLESPDIFRINSVNSSLGSSVIDLSKSDADVDEIENSPTLISKRKKRRKQIKHGKAKKNFEVVGKQESLILVNCTPPETNVETHHNKVKSDDGRKKKSPQVSSGSNKACDQVKPHYTSIGKNTTFLDSDDDAREMSISQLLSIINEPDNIKENSVYKQGHFDDQMDSISDEILKEISFDNSSRIEDCSKKKVKPAPGAEPVVRGHARKLLKGFLCEQCRDFYGCMNLSPKELQDKLNACSKHRYKYQPPEDTHPGIWDMSIPGETMQ